MKSTPLETIDDSIRELSQRKADWAKLEIPQLIEHLDATRNRVLELSRTWVETACEIKSVAFDSDTSAEEWIAGPMLVLRHLRLLRETLLRIARGLPTVSASTVSEGSDGRTRARVFPADLSDRLLYAGFTGDIEFGEGVRRDDVLSQSASKYRKDRGTSEGRVVAVLGAGNVTSIAPLDLLTKLFIDRAVCILKVHPLLARIGPILESVLEGFVKSGALRFAYGDAAAGSAVVEHPLVDEVHLTGSDATHDAIVWGPEDEREDRKREGRRCHTKDFTSELGCVTPVIIAPGKWTSAQLRFHAESVASMVANNSSFNCNSAKLLITHSGWKQREEFLSTLRSVFQTLPTRFAYYPGADQKYSRFVDAHPNSEVVGQAGDGELPWTLATSLDSSEDDPAFREEAWSPVLAETALDANDPSEFLARAANFANERVWGTLSCGLLIDPKTSRAHSTAFESALASLRYGTVVVNHWPALGYGLGVTPWGAFPGHTAEDIQSGVGFVHNTLMLESTERTVVRGPFVVRPKPPWFSTKRRNRELAEILTQFERKPGLLPLLRVGAAAIRS
ncbi:MAG: aldehyde dehydrogenase [Planctomycetota bacterium]